MQLSADEWELVASFTPYVITEKHIPQILASIDRTVLSAKYPSIVRKLESFDIKIEHNRITNIVFPPNTSIIVIKKLRSCVKRHANYSLKARCIRERLYPLKVGLDLCEQIKDHYLAPLDELLRICEDAGADFDRSPIPAGRRHQFLVYCQHKSLALFIDYGDVVPQERLLEMFSIMDPRPIYTGPAHKKLSPALSRLAMEHPQRDAYIQYCDLPRPLTYTESKIMDFLELEDPELAKEAYSELDTLRYRIVPRTPGQAIAWLTQPDTDFDIRPAVRVTAVQFTADDLLMFYHLLVATCDGYYTCDKLPVICRLPNNWHVQLAETWGRLNNHKDKITAATYNDFLRRYRDMAFFCVKKVLTQKRFRRLRTC